MSSVKGLSAFHRGGRWVRRAALERRATRDDDQDTRSLGDHRRGTRGHRLRIRFYLIRFASIQVLQLEAADVAIAADPTAMRQVLINLVRNALEAMPTGGTITLGTSASEDGVTLSVHDTGIGIPASDLDRVFLLFHTTKREGTGVGLAMVHRLVSLHEGRVDIESPPGKGTLVVVRVPRAAHAPVSEEDAGSLEAS